MKCVRYCGYNELVIIKLDINYQHFDAVLTHIGLKEK